MRGQLCRGPVIGLVLVVALVSTARARAEDPPVPAGETIGRAQMDDELHRFFREDKRHAAVLGSVGIASLVAGGVLVSRPGFARATSYPLLGVGLVQAVVGAGIFLRTNKQVAQLETRLSSDPAGLRADEHRRMTRLHRQYLAVEIAETAMVIAGTTLLAVGAHRDDDLMGGIGLGLLIEGAVTLPLDIIADRRGERYRRSLARFQVGLARLPLPGTPSSAPAPLALVARRVF